VEHHVAIAPIGSKDRCGARAVPRRPGADKSVAFPDRSIHVGLSSASAHGGGAVAAVHRIARYICVLPLRICYHAPCWCVCV
jgi:hypothetical protein